jgi:glycosyltransferase involved in cell wall biosynthesis
MTRISIVTPSFNQGCFLREALESVRLQSHCNVEHLILDGGSTDDTIAQLQSLTGDPRWSHVRWHSGPDAGQSDALNKGFKMATGEIVGWLNSDDRYRPGCFDHVVKAFEENPGVDVFYGDYTFMDEDGTVRQIRREIEFNPFILLYHRVLYIGTTATFFRRRIFDDQNWLSQNLHYAMDYEFFLRLVAEEYRFRHIPQVLADFRLHPQSKTCSMEEVQLQEKRNIMLRYSPVTRLLNSVRLRSMAILWLQTVAGLMRWTEKMLRGFYFSQDFPESLDQ